MDGNKSAADSTSGEAETLAVEGQQQINQPDELMLRSRNLGGRKSDQLNSERSGFQQTLCAVRLRSIV